MKFKWNLNIGGIKWNEMKVNGNENGRKWNEIETNVTKFNNEQ